MQYLGSNEPLGPGVCVQAERLAVAQSEDPQATPNVIRQHINFLTGQKKRKMLKLT